MGSSERHWAGRPTIVRWHSSRLAEGRAEIVILVQLERGVSLLLRLPRSPFCVHVGRHESSSWQAYRYFDNGLGNRAPFDDCLLKLRRIDHGSLLTGRL
jgi:hypothetical protein